MTAAGQPPDQMPCIVCGHEASRYGVDRVDPFGNTGFWICANETNCNQRLVFEARKRGSNT